MDRIKLTTFNCNSIVKNIDMIRKLLGSNDILCVQETLLVHELSGYLSGIDPEFDVCFTPAIAHGHMFGGRPSGGLAIFWRGDLGGRIEPMNFQPDIMGLKIIVNDHILLILNIYLPYERNDSDSREHYSERISCIASILDTENFDDVIILGDYNADRQRGGNWNLLSPLFNDFNLIQADLHLPAESFTFISSCHYTTSWLDHILTNNTDLVSNVEISNEVITFDHLLMSYIINATISGVEAMDEIHVREFIKWDLFENDDVRRTYGDDLDEILNSFDISGLACRKSNCRDKSHLRLIDDLNSFLVNALKEASRTYRFTHNSKNYTVPGWNSYCKGNHALAREHF